MSKGGKPETQGGIGGLPYAGIAVYQEKDGSQGSFVTRLRKALDAYEAGTCWFENIDVSQVKWPINGFGELIKILHEYKVKTQRFKAYKCDLNDQAFKWLVRWLDAIPPEGVPDEFHLSNNNITNEGFMQLLVAIEKHVAQDGWNRKPVWLRVEFNQVEPNALWKLESEGRVTFCEIKHRKTSRTAIAMPPVTTKGGGAEKAKEGGGKAKGKGAISTKGKSSGDDAAPTSTNASLAKKKGAGPATAKDGGKAAQDSAGETGGDSRNGGGSNWWEKSDGWQNGGNWWEKKWDGDSKDAAWSDARGSNGSPENQQQPPQQQQAQQQQPAPSLQQPQAKQQELAKPDRSRSPRKAAAATPATPAVEENLPKGWQKKFSKEYGIPYYWNTTSLESRWEKPTS